jgi:hypothetical protein
MVLLLLLVVCLHRSNTYRHANYNLKAHDYVSLRLDVVIWLVCWATGPSAAAMQLLTVLCCLSAVLALAVHCRHPATYTVNRTAITTARRIITLPYILHLASKTYSPKGPVAAVVLHLLVQTGALHNFAGSLFFLQGWRVGAYLAAEQRCYLVLMCAVSPLRRATCSVCCPNRSSSGDQTHTAQVPICPPAVM